MGRELAITSVDRVASLGELLGRHAERAPESIALRLRAGPVTYADLEARSNRVAGALLESGHGPGERIAFLGRTAVEYFELLFGAAKVGAVTVPVNWRLAPPEIAAILADAGATALVVDEAFAAPARELRGSLPDLRASIGIGVEGFDHDFEAWLGSRGGGDIPEAPGGTEDVALQVYTSGTTGKPKGALISNAALVEYLAVLAGVARFERQSVSLCSLPMFHIGGNGWVLAGMYEGCETILLPETVPAELLEMIDRHRVTVAFAVPAVLKMMLDSPAVEATDFGSLRTLYYGGSPITENVLKAALEVLGCDFVQGFGMTECGLVTALGPEDHDPERRPELLRSCGRAVPPNEVRLVDPESLEDVPMGVVGELWVRSPLLMSGYYRRPEETAAAITPDGWLRTGDAARRDTAGYLYIEDRIKDMIISGGENIYSAEVENVLMDHSEVADCAVIGVSSERWGETVKAIVVPREGSGVEAEELIEYCRGRLARYKCPTSVDAVAELPRTPSGKVVKHELRARYDGGTEGR